MTLLPRSARPRAPAGAALAAALALAATLGGCQPPAVPGTVVSGKVAYRGMGIEEAEVRARRWEGGAWADAAAIRSGYHGSFALRLPPGRYRLEAQIALPGARDPLPLRGVTEGLELAPGAPRVDRVVVELKPE